MTKYNGHRNYDYWNVSLWINNDEGLYNLARDCVRHNRTKTEAAKLMLATLTECDITSTPDGAKYTLDKVRRAMEGM
jgi:hypothetical protein